MKSLSVFMKDLGAVFKNPKMRISMFAILFIPVLYSGLFLKAFWDPYGKMNELPVAVVNQDKGADYEGTKLTAGEDLVTEPEEDGRVQVEFRQPGAGGSRACGQYLLYGDCGSGRLLGQGNYTAGCRPAAGQDHLRAE